jgi:phosphate transport system ATP-binding protein
MVEINEKVYIEKFNLWFGKNHILKDITFGIRDNSVTAIMGPSGCGKTTLLRSINRMSDLTPTCRTEGSIYLNKENVYDKSVNVYELRKKIGMVFQKPNPFPKSIYENVAYGPKTHKMAKGKELNEIVKRSLQGAALWQEVKDRLNDNAFDLSGGQQQRLCIARALAIEPVVILMDEPCSALDPAATARIEKLMRILSEKYTVVIVTHNMQQAARVSDYTAFLYVGDLIEYGETKNVFENPKNELTEKYITGEFG